MSHQDHDRMENCLVVSFSGGEKVIIHIKKEAVFLEEEK